MKKLLVCVVALGALSATFAAASDLPTRKPAPVFVAPATNWGGFYIGGNVGYGWDPASAAFDPASLAKTVLTGPLGPYTISGSSGPQSLSVHPQGWLGGAQVGYNWQQNALVFGLEADIDWSGMKGATSAPFFVNGVTAPTLRGDLADFTGNVGLQQKVDYFGTFRGRLGWANDALLLYGTGGFAWGHVNTSFNTFNIANAPATPGGLSAAQLAGLQVGASSSSIRPGFAVGAGLEWKVAQNWSVKAEYLYIDLLGGDTLTIPGGTAKAGNTSVQVARVGLNYFFGGP
ncbi:outer membrane protein [Methylocapsa sp. S129]|uniref:outer membrane protein n=1 Tax=Methylocapsa sp. S129 TaxID=1641869 RepID=UPI00131CFD1C|nr:outer membrane beta-barrel protein [Methylocapsa sp. S129]